jgi:hypothetical protein
MLNADTGKQEGKVQGKLSPKKRSYQGTLGRATLKNPITWHNHQGRLPMFLLTTKKRFT